MVNKAECIEQRQYIYDGNEEHLGTCTSSSIVSTMRSMEKLLNTWYMWHICWKSISILMGQIVWCVSSVTNITITLKTSSLHLPHSLPCINSQEVNTVNYRTRPSPLYLATMHKVVINNL